MDDPLRVRGLQSVDDLGGDRDRLRHIEPSRTPPTCRSRSDSLREGRSLDQLEDEGGHARVVLEPVDGADPGVIQRGERLRLPFEPGQPSRIAAELARKHLDRDLAPEPRVASAVDLAHASAPEGRDHLVGTEPGTARQRHLGA
jgi:hypothetical protein